MQTGSFGSSQPVPENAIRGNFRTHVNVKTWSFIPRGIYNESNNKHVMGLFFVLTITYTRRNEFVICSQIVKGQDVIEIPILP